jgi:hypothetical protein
MNYLVRIAFALFDHLVADNESLKGDLIEELENGRSVWWLWCQVIGATARHPPSVTRVGMFALATALLMLLSFEAVVVTNLVVRIVFGAPFPNISGYLYLPASDSSAAQIAPVPIIWTLVSVLTVAVSLPTGRLIARLHERHRMLGLAGFGCSTMLCATITMQAGVFTQFVTMVGFVVGLFLGSRVLVSKSAVIMA